MRNNVKYPRTDETFGGWFGPYVYGNTVTVTLLGKVNIACNFEVSFSGCHLIAEISSQGCRPNSVGYFFTLSIQVRTAPTILAQLLQMGFETFNLWGCLNCTIQWTRNARWRLYWSANLGFLKTMFTNGSDEMLLPLGLCHCWGREMQTK